YCHMEEEHWRSGGYPQYGVTNQSLLDLNIVASQHLKRWMVKRGADAARIEVAHINVDPVRWQPDQELPCKARAAQCIPLDTPVILYACRLCPQKRPKLFAKVMLELSRQPVEFLALVAGDGEDSAWLKQFLAEHHLTSRVRMLGERSSSEM